MSDGDPGPVADRIAGLRCWPGSVTITPFAGSERVWMVESAGRRMVARLLRTSRLHGLVPSAAIDASLAAGAAGLGPPVRHAGAGFLVLDHVEGANPTPADLAEPACLRRCLDVVEAVARLDIGSAMLVDRSLVATLRHYLGVLAGTPWASRVALLAPALDLALRHPASAQPCAVHGDLHGGNLIWDGSRIWLIDWEYAGAGDPLLDLASLAVNTAIEQHDGLQRERRFREAPDRFASLRLGAALRDLLWGYAESFAGAPLPHPDYLSINEDRVRRAAEMVNGS